MNYRRLAARAGLPAWMLLSQFSFAQEIPAEDQPLENEKTEEPLPEGTPTNETVEKTAPTTPSLPTPKLPTPKPPGDKTNEEMTDLPEVEVPLDGIPIAPEIPLPEGDPLLNHTGDASLLPVMGPEAPAPEISGLGMDEPPSLLDEPTQNSGSLLDEQTAISGRDSNTEGLVLSIGVTESYTSNLELDERDPLSLLYTTIEPGFSYRSAPSGGAINVFAFDYTAGLDIYHHGAVDNATNHRVASILTHNGSKLFAEFTGEFFQATEASRFTETLSENTTSSVALKLNYKLSGKTSLSASAEYSRTESDAGTADATDLFGASLSGLYIYSPKLSIGPSIRVANSDSGVSGKVSSFAYGVDIRYRPTPKIFLQSTLGVENVDLPRSGSESSPTATLGIQYRPNPIWSFNGEIRYEAIPINSRTNSTVGLLPGEDSLARLNGPSSDGDQQINAILGINYTPGTDWLVNATFTHRTSPSMINPGESIVDTSFSLGVTRNFGKSDLSLRLSHSSTDFEGTTMGAVNSRGDQQFRQISLQYSYPELFNGFDLNAGISYQENSGSRDYDETGISVSAFYRF